MYSTPLAYSIAKACALSSVGRTTLYAAISRGDLRTRKVGRRTLITAQDLQSWLDNCSIDPGKAAGKLLSGGASESKGGQ